MAHSREKESMPLPSVLGPDTSESPLLAIFIDAGDDRQQVENRTALADLLPDGMYLLVGHPFVGSECTIGLLGTSSHEFMIRSESYLF